MNPDENTCTVRMVADYQFYQNVGQGQDSAVSIFEWTAFLRGEESIFEWTEEYLKKTLHIYVHVRSNFFVTNKESRITNLLYSNVTQERINQIFV